MILRKPYAFFIKSFRLMHIIITILMGYLAFKTYPILQFLDGYLANQVSYVGKSWTQSYFNNLMFIFPIIVILMSVIIMSVLIRKKKPSLFYLINIFAMVLSILYYSSLYSSMSLMETQIVNIQLMRAYKDFAIFILVFQFTAILITFARASGFDIKKFDFGKDLKELNLNDSDREEVEVQINIDTDKVKRKRNYLLRHIKYYYLENKKAWNITIIFLMLVIIIYSLLNNFVFNKTYLYSNYFRASNFTMKIDDCYLLTEDNYGNKITDNGKSLIVVNIQIKTTVNGVVDTLPTYRTALLLNNIHYYPTTKYRDKISDLGLTYDNQKIDNTYNYYLLTYEIPTSDLNKNMEFNYMLGYNFGKTIEPNIIHVSLGYKNLDGAAKETTYNMNDIAHLNESVASDINLSITKAEINTTFESDYSFCYNSKCLASKELIKPVINTNYDKALLKLNVNYGTNENIDNLKKFTDLVNYYGKIEYKLNDKTYTSTLDLITPKNISDLNVYYIEINKNVMNASDIYFILDVRNYTYRFKIK